MVVFFGVTIGDVVFFGVTGGVEVTVGDIVLLGITGGVGVTVEVRTEMVHVSVKLSWGSSASLSKSSSSPLNSCKTHVWSTTTPVVSRICHVRTSISPLREKCVPIVVLENDFKSYKSSLAAVGLIKR